MIEDSVYAHAGPNCIAEYTRGTAATSPIREYVHGDEIDSLVMLVDSGGTRKLAVTRNQQWSVTALVNEANGKIVERYSYDQFGKRTVHDADGFLISGGTQYGNPYGYTSRRHDATSGLMHFRARDYDPSTGEFLTRDPLGYVDGWSLYRGYFLVQNSDPTGLEADERGVKPNIPGIVPFAGNLYCWTVSMSDFVKWWSSQRPNQVTPEFVDNISRGCIGITSTYQAFNKCERAFVVFPEFSNGTYCYAKEEQADNHRCGENQNKFVFAKQGVWRVGTQPIAGDDGRLPNDSIVGSKPGYYNYIAKVDGWYVWGNYGVNAGPDPQVRICTKPLNSQDYPNEIWCVTCSDKCPANSVPDSTLVPETELVPVSPKPITPETELVPVSPKPLGSRINEGWSSNPTPRTRVNEGWRID